MLTKEMIQQETTWDMETCGISEDHLKEIIQQEATSAVETCGILLRKGMRIMP